MAFSGEFFVEFTVKHPEIGGGNPYQMSQCFQAGTLLEYCLDNRNRTFDRIVRKMVEESFPEWKILSIDYYEEVE